MTWKSVKFGKNFPCVREGEEKVMWVKNMAEGCQRTRRNKQHWPKQALVEPDSGDRFGRVFFRNKIWKFYENLKQSWLTAADDLNLAKNVSINGGKVSQEHGGI